MRGVAAGTVLTLVLTACAAGEEPEPAGTAAPNDRETTETTAAAEPTTSPEATGEPSATPSEQPHPVSLPGLAARDLDGGDLTLGRVVLRTASQTQYDVTYRSGDLTISGRLAVPEGEGPFPAIVLAHGYIDPAIYTIGRGMTRERAWFADNGWIALHVDYRNHGGSDRDPDADLELRLGYTEDVISAVHALRGWDGPIDGERMAIGGRSMGGGVVYNALVVRPGLVDAGVVWAPVSSDTVDNFERWIRPDPGREGIAREIIAAYGDPTDPGAADFWAEVSPRTFFDRITEPVMIHHGTNDDTCPIAWSDATDAALRDAGVRTRYEVYPGEGHAFGPQFVASMERTGDFLDVHVR